MVATITACDATNVHHYTSLRLCEAAANRKKAYVTSSPLPQGDHPPQRFLRPYIPMSMRLLVVMLYEVIGITAAICAISEQNRK